VRFHAIYWPAFLMAADLPLPRRIFAHGWLLFEQDKMSKSRGNIVRATPIQQVMGIDALRYFLLREIVFGQDGSFSYDALVGRYNSDLANGLGNLASRVLTMIRQYCGGVVPPAAGDPEVAKSAAETVSAFVPMMEEFEFSKALECVWALLSVADRYIVQQAPWVLAKKPELQDKLHTALYSAAEVLRIATVLLAPVLPQSTAKIWRQLGMGTPLESCDPGALLWGQLEAGQKIGEIAAVFPRVDAKVAIEKMQQLEKEETARQAALLGKKEAAPPPAPLADPISIEDFAKVDMRVGLVLSAELVQGADKLLHLQVDIGEAQPRSLVAGIATAYKPEQLVGRKVVMVANLQPRKLRGIESNGMIVAASIEGDRPVLVGFLEDVPVGTRLK
jgi:methionyl-tRNA synthetase